MKTILNRIFGKAKFTPTVIVLAVMLVATMVLYAFIGEWLYACVSLLYLAIIYVYARALFRIQVLKEINGNLSYTNEMQAQAFADACERLSRPSGKIWDVFFDLPDSFTADELKKNLYEHDVRSIYWKVTHKWKKKGLVKQEGDRYAKIK